MKQINANTFFLTAMGRQMPPPRMADREAVPAPSFATVQEGETAVPPMFASEEITPTTVRKTEKCHPYPAGRGRKKGSMFVSVDKANNYQRSKTRGEKQGVFTFSALFSPAKRKRIWAALMLLCLLCAACLPLSACGREKTPSDIWAAFSLRYALPPGHTYDSTAPQTSEAYLSREMFAELYARADGTDDWEDFEQCVIWQGTAGTRVTEAAVFLCRDRERAERIALLCMRRLEMIRALKSYTDTTCADTAVIRLYGRHVVFLVLPDNGKAAAVMDRMM